MAEVLPEALAEGADVVAEPIKQGVRALILKVPEIRNFVSSTAVDIVPKLVSSGVNTADPLGLQPDKYAMQDLMGTVFEKTTELTMLVSEDAAEVLTESVSEAMSNAAYSAVGGLIDAMARYKVGGMPPQDFYDGEVLSPHAQAYLDVLAGYMYHFTVLRRLDKMFVGLRDSLLSDPLFMGYLESYRWAYSPKVSILSIYGRMMEAMAMRVLESVAAVLEALFARAEDAAQEYRAAEILYTNGQITQPEFDQIAAKVSAELDAINQEIDDVLADLATALQNWQPIVPSGFDNLNNMMLDTLTNAENDMIDTMNIIIGDVDVARDKGRPSTRSYYVMVNNAQSIVQPTG